MRARRSSGVGFGMGVLGDRPLGKADIAFTPQFNTRGETSLQLVIRDMCASGQVVLGGKSENAVLC
jgi:hypothetical protein